MKNTEKTWLQFLKTDNSQWTFWSHGWTKSVQVIWGGKTPWKQVVASAKKALKVPLMGCERAIEIRTNNQVLTID